MIVFIKSLVTFIISVFRYKLKKLKYADKGLKYELLTIDRVKGIWVPEDQAKDLNQINEFVSTNSQKDDVFMMFPEIGVYHFIFDRPFLGRFPFCDLSWLNDRWFEGYFHEFKQGRAKYVLVQKQMPEGWEKIYFGYAPNKRKYDQVKVIIDQDYQMVEETEGTWIYKRKQ